MVRLVAVARAVAFEVDVAVARVVASVAAVVAVRVVVSVGGEVVVAPHPQGAVVALLAPLAVVAREGVVGAVAALGGAAAATEAAAVAPLDVAVVEGVVRPVRAATLLGYATCVPTMLFVQWGWLVHGEGRRWVAGKAGGGGLMYRDVHYNLTVWIYCCSTRVCVWLLTDTCWRASCVYVCLWYCVGIPGRV